jgi:hypothetical protein
MAGKGIQALFFLSPDCILFMRASKCSLPLLLSGLFLLIHPPMARI